MEGGAIILPSAFAVAACAFALTAYSETGPWFHLPALPRLPSLRRPALPTISTKRVGGLRFVKVGRLTMSFCLAKSAAPLR